MEKLGPNAGSYWCHPYPPAGPSVSLSFLLPYLWQKEMREVRRERTRYTHVLVSFNGGESKNWGVFVGTRVQCDSEAKARNMKLGEGMIYQLGARRDPTAEYRGMK